MAWSKPSPRFCAGAVRGIGGAASQLHHRSKSCPSPWLHTGCEASLLLLICKITLNPCVSALPIYIDVNWLTIPPEQGKVHSLLEWQSLAQAWLAVLYFSGCQTGWGQPERRKKGGYSHLPRETRYYEWMINLFLSIHLSIYLSSIYPIAEEEDILLYSSRFFWLV